MADQWQNILVSLKIITIQNIIILIIAKKIIIYNVEFDLINMEDK